MFLSGKFPQNCWRSFRIDRNSCQGRNNQNKRKGRKERVKERKDKGGSKMRRSKGIVKGRIRRRLRLRKGRRNWCPE